VIREPIRRLLPALESFQFQELNLPPSETF
jgi:hypothetical protein